MRARGGASRRAPRATSRRGRVAPARALSSPPRPRRHPPRASPEQSVALASGSSSRSDRNTRIGWRRARSGPSPARSNARARDGRDASARGVTPSAGTNAIVIRSAVGSSKRSMFSCRCAIDVTTMRRFSDTPAPSLTLARDSNSVHLRWERGERGRGEMKRRKKGPGGRRRRRHRDPQNRRMYCWLRSQKFIADLDVFSSSGTGAGARRRIRRIGIVPNVALDYGCLRNASGEYAATHGRRREVLAGVNYSRLDVNEGETQRPAAGYQKMSARVAAARRLRF